MKKLFYALAFILIAISVFFNVSAFAGGAGGSWGDDSGFGGNGGSTGGGGGGGSWDTGTGQCTSGFGNYSFSGSPSSVCSEMNTTYKAYYGSKYTVELKNDGDAFYCYIPARDRSYPVNCSTPPESCPSGQIFNGSKCVLELKCPAGYVKDGNKCIWQCPVGYKMLGGNCVKDDMPEDCDPAIQTCDENGEPVCDCCGALTQLVNMTNTQINNDNRIISLSETSVSNQNTIINNTENINNNISNVNTNITNVNNNLTTINESIENVITTIENNKPDFDTTAIENKLDEVVNAIRNNNGVGEDGVPIDLTEILRLLNEIDQGVKDSKFDDTQLNAYFDEILEKGIPVGVDFEPVTERQDEQTSLLEDIKRLLLPTNEAGEPDLNLPEVEQTSFDPWGAIKGFDINSNVINASSQCPADKSFTVMGATFSIPMTPMCTYLGYLAPIFLAIAYFQGAMIILRSGD